MVPFMKEETFHLREITDLDTVIHDVCQHMAYCRRMLNEETVRDALKSLAAACSNEVRNTLVSPGEQKQYIESHTALREYETYQQYYYQYYHALRLVAASLVHARQRNADIDAALRIAHRGLCTEDAWENVQAQWAESVEDLDVRRPPAPHRIMRFAKDILHDLQEQIAECGMPNA
jgi:hypothetical protein